jgi:hypothetical protein
MTTSHVEYPRVVSRAEWLAARKAFVIAARRLADGWRHPHEIPVADLR